MAVFNVWGCNFHSVLTAYSLAARQQRDSTIWTRVQEPTHRWRGSRVLNWADQHLDACDDQEVVMTTTAYSTFRIANEYLDDYEKLNAVFDKQGYLFFREVLDTNKVLEVKRDFIRELHR